MILLNNDAQSRRFSFWRESPALPYLIRYALGVHCALLLLGVLFSSPDPVEYNNRVDPDSEAVGSMSGKEGIACRLHPV